MQSINNPSFVIPMVTEDTARGERAYDIFSMLLNNRIILVGDEINDRTANLVVAQLLHLSSVDPEEPIQMYIQSPGGIIYHGLAIYDTMQVIPNRIATVAIGVTASFATVLLAGGSPGSATPCPTPRSICTSRGAAQGARPPISRSRRANPCASNRA